MNADQIRTLAEIKAELQNVLERITQAGSIQKRPLLDDLRRIYGKVDNFLNTQTAIADDIEKENLKEQ